ncbi:hypothetical protein [Clostridium thailandense]|uniref:hypothetical protein n=1 Tax=Clostridium thailandense TaxID=2794346 RepID=UPI003988DA04
MKRIKFNRPTNHYDERAKQIDEKICELIRERKKVSENNPGYPPFEYISEWAEKFDLYEDLLKSIFGSMYNEKGYKPMVEPEGFLRNLPILKSVEVGNRFFSIIYIRQYSNCSVVNLNIDWDNSGDSIEHRFEHTHFELFINQHYECRFTGGTGGDGHTNYSFIVSPPLPDNVSGIELIFKEYTIPITDTTVGQDIIIQL